MQIEEPAHENKCVIIQKLANEVVHSVKSCQNIFIQDLNVQQIPAKFVFTSKSGTIIGCGTSFHKGTTLKGAAWSKGQMQLSHRK